MNNLFEYFIYSFLITISLFIFGITFIRSKNYGQYVRKLGPQSHFKKQGTPIFGGVVMVIGAILGFIYFSFNEKTFDIRYFIILFLPVFMYAIIGFIDDFFKVRYKNNDGLSIKSKLIMQLIFAIVYYFLIKDKITQDLKIFNFTIDIGYFYILLILLMFLSTTNAFNFCDGMDGLASGIGVIILSGLLLVSLFEDNYYISVFIALFIGAILAFICFNHKPAKIFMGDSGSMAIGALICNLSILLKIEFLLLVFGFVMIIETLSIIIQVVYFKISNGKRVFLMAPIHHHFELKGYKESVIVYCFWFIQLICTIIGFILYYKFYL